MSVAGMDVCNHTQAAASASAQLQRCLVLRMALSHMQNIRIRHTIILDDPFQDPQQLSEHIPESSPEPVMIEVGAALAGC